MNEKIKQLAEQAGFVFWEMTGDIDWRQANSENFDEFARLLVTEITEYAYNHNALTRIDALSIQARYGVEE